jgi:hypothetical protein
LIKQSKEEVEDMLTKKESIKSEVKGSKGQKATTATSQEEHVTHEGASPKTSKSYTPKNLEENPDYLEKRLHQKTQVTVRYNVGYGNQLYIRGRGANLSWEKGIPLKNVKANEWIWETETSFSHCEFKVLINDRNYENGENHYLNPGASIIYTPHFYQ